MKNDRDASYEIGPTATVTNDVWLDGTCGKVTVMARRGDTGDRTPLLTCTLKLADGKTVECKQDRSTIWNNVDLFEALSLRCTSELDLSTVVNVGVVSAHGPEWRSGGAAPTPGGDTGMGSAVDVHRCRTRPRVTPLLVHRWRCRSTVPGWP
jgi:hypothetical protein